MEGLQVGSGEVGGCTQTNRLSSFLFKDPYPWVEHSFVPTKMNYVLENGNNWGGGHIPFSDLRDIPSEATPSAMVTYRFEPEAVQVRQQLSRRRIYTACPHCPLAISCSNKSVDVVYSDVIKTLCVWRTWPWWQYPWCLSWTEFTNYP
jgi:hypothetical protein